MTLVKIYYLVLTLLIDNNFLPLQSFVKEYFTFESFAHMHAEGFYSIEN